MSVHPSAPERARVLLVEDNPINRHIVGEYLTLSGFEVHEASCAADAVETLRVRACHALLVDLHLPDEPGTSLIRRLRKHPDPHISHAVMAFLTASSMESDREAGLSAGADLFVSKPARLRELARILREYVLKRFPQLPGAPHPNGHPPIWIPPEDRNHVRKITNFV